MLLCGLGLAIPGQVGYDSKAWRPWIVWSGWVPFGVDDGRTGKLTLSAALSDPFLNFLEDVGDVEGQMVRRCRHHRDLLAECQLTQRLVSQIIQRSEWLAGHPTEFPIWTHVSPP
jgi:hypothetical protein